VTQTLSDKIRFQIFRSHMIGTKLAHYEITSHVGSGGMGDLFQGTDTKLGRSVAIKFQHPIKLALSEHQGLSVYFGHF
jgi:serine/threonine protein kinase